MPLNHRQILVQTLIQSCPNITNTSVDLKTLEPTIATSDSRKCVENSIFFATRLSVEQYEERYWYMYKPNPEKYFFDGHPYIDAAINNGAKVIVCEELPNKLYSGVAYFKVDNVIEFMGSVTKNLVESVNTKIIAVTGSSGKTTVVHCINTVLQNAGLKANKLYTTRPTPITLPEMIFSLALSNTGIPNYLVVEMPTDRKGAIKRLCSITPPDISLIFNIKEAHSKTLGGIHGVVEAKSEIITHQKDNGLVILNADDFYLRKAIDMSKRLKKKIITFGVKNGDIKGKVLEQFDTTTLAEVALLKKKSACNIKLLGESGLYTALAAAAVGYALNLDIKTIEKGLASFSPMPGRMSWHILDSGRIKLFSNYAKGTPANTKHILELINNLPWDGKRILVLGDFDFHEEEQADKKVWHIINSKFDCVLLTGKRAVKYQKHLSAEIVVHTTEDKETTLKELQKIAACVEKAYIVVNGSLEFKHSELVNEFLKKYE
ncbi:MAG: Mur ligase family protein [Patescibacteria group bacterium]|uniref:Mur ligase central domain-containing protein n=1 Tax=candidate division WWE3 bacterium TaxID=2053526 RepID=A0A955EE45_UNCKA|nr:hypothetical protein [candidate division WWE3 bacterium]